MDEAYLAELRRTLDNNIRSGLLWVTDWRVTEGYQLLDYIAALEARIRQLEDRE